mmetsp:Transcript_17530/g.70973  ORF Transcript_17530/g.70973 Transcript_17530/m.70973 type:complete len:200 (-) Transcript_17530:38-637(-)
MYSGSTKFSILLFTKDMFALCPRPVRKTIFRCSWARFLSNDGLAPTPRILFVSWSISTPSNELAASITMSVVRPSIFRVLNFKNTSALTHPSGDIFALRNQSLFTFASENQNWSLSCTLLDFSPSSNVDAALTVHPLLWLGLHTFGLALLRTSIPPKPPTNPQKNILVSVHHTKLPTNTIPTTSNHPKNSSSSANARGL